MSLLSADRAQTLLERIRGRCLLVLGDLMLDEYLFGEVSRISAEAPVPVVRVRRESYRLGGAGNVAANAEALGASALLVGVLGADLAAERFRADAVRRNLAAGGLVADPGRPTTLKTRVIAHSQQVVRCDREEDRPLSPEVEQQVIDAFRTALAGADAVVVSDYGKGVLTARVLAEALTAAAARRLPAVIDPTVRSIPLYQPATALTPNHHEAVEGAQLYGRDDGTILAAGKRLLERLALDSVLVTRGENGMTLFERSGAVTHIPTVAREVYDVTGAGDTVSTVFTLALSAGAAPVEAAALANHAAGVVVGKVGTSVASANEILRSVAPLAPPRD